MDDFGFNLTDSVGVMLMSTAAKMLPLLHSHIYSVL